MSETRKEMGRELEANREKKKINKSRMIGNNVLPGVIYNLNGKRPFKKDVIRWKLGIEE